MNRSSEAHSLKISKTGRDPNLRRRRPQSRTPGLYIVATPIGNASDIGLRALDLLKDCDVIAAEDTRVTAKLLAIHGISRPLTIYSDRNAAQARPRLLDRLRKGETVALVSDAGTPLISDPGYKLVREAITEGLPVQVVPGPSAAIAALTLSGLPPDRFLFAGFLPARPGERRTALAELKSAPATLIFFESPQRLPESLRDSLEVLGNRPAAVARELTKLHETVARGDLAVLAAEFANQSAPKGEIVIVVAPPLESAPDWPKADGLLAKALPFMPLSAAAGLVAAALDLPKRAVYERALKLKIRHEEH